MFSEFKAEKLINELYHYDIVVLDFKPHVDYFTIIIDLDGTLEEYLETIINILSLYSLVVDAYYESVDDENNYLLKLVSNSMFRIN